MPYPDNYVSRGAPDSEPPVCDDAPDPITASEAARFEAAAKPYRAIFAALHSIADDSRRIGTAEMIGLADMMMDAINDCIPLAAICAWDDDTDDFSNRQAFDQMMDEVAR